MLKKCWDKFFIPNHPLLQTRHFNLERTLFKILKTVPFFFLPVKLTHKLSFYKKFSKFCWVFFFVFFF